MPETATDLELDELEEEEEDDEFYDDEEEGAEQPYVSTHTSEDKVRMMAAAMYSLKGTNIIALDLRELTIIADFFLFCTGNSSIQIRSIADRVEERLREQGERKNHVEGFREATWILLDYGDVVVHVMAEDQREHFNIEGRWEEAPRFDLELPADA